jgi:hypothetical protein
MVILGTVEQMASLDATGSSRNTELIINMNNILLTVSNDNFSILQLPLCLNWFLHFFTYHVQCLLGGHHPLECTGARVEKMCKTSQSVFSEIMMILSHTVCLSAFKSKGHLLYALRFKYPHRKMSGALRSGKHGGHDTSPKPETTHCGHKRR